MNLKQIILSLLGRDELKVIVDHLGLEDLDRRSVEAMRDALSRARRAQPEGLLEYLYEDGVKAVCEAYTASLAPAGGLRSSKRSCKLTAGPDQGLMRTSNPSSLARNREMKPEQPRRRKQ